MKFFVALFFLAQCSLSFGQHSERFITLVENLKPSDSSFVEDYYSDGVIKRKGALLYYDMPEYNYSKRTGLWLEYYKNGVIKTKSVYDNFGNVISKSLYNLQGSISSEMTTTIIDTALENSEDYFLRNDEVSITLRLKNYKFGAEIDKIYLRETGVVKGGKRIGVWKLYSQRGKLEKEIDYDNK